jgi:hypothetical protein
MHFASSILMNSRALAAFSKKKTTCTHTQLVKKLQGQAALEAEVTRSRTSMIDIRAKIDGALGNCPFQAQCDAGNGLSCDAVAQCFLGKGETGNCGPSVMNCYISPGSEQNSH